MPPRQVYVRNCFAQEWVVLRRVGINGLMDPTVYREIRLFVALQVERRNSNMAWRWRLED
jgi:hypothetical protein